MARFNHQQKIIDEDPKCCGLFLGTGASKTRISLDLARGKTLAIVPKTQKEDGNWERENKKWECGVDLTVISKETFRRDHAKLPRFDTVIVDEAHTCLGATPNVRWKNRRPIPKTSQLFEALESFVARTKPSRLYLATATIIRSPMTVWAAARLLGKQWDFYRFRDAFYFRLPMPGREVWQAKSDDETKDRLAGAVRRLGYVGRLEDFFDVPEQTYKTDYLELTAKQKARIKDMTTEFPDPLVRVGKIHQIENGVLAGDEFNEAEKFENAKIDKILDYAIEFPRMVVFAKYKAQIGFIAEALIATGYKVWILTGDTKDRGQVIKEANENDGILICQAQISAGWELPNTPVMIFASMTYSFVDRIQAEGRILRANHLKKNLFITLIVRDGVDSAVNDCIANKKDFHERQFVEDTN